jgi:hypothetical protein
MDDIDAVCVSAKTVKDGMASAHEFSKGSEEPQGCASTASSKGDTEHHLRDKVGQLDCIVSHQPYIDKKRKDSQDKPSSPMLRPAYLSPLLASAKRHPQEEVSKV